MRINIKAKPNSREEKIAKVGENNFEVWVKEPPVQGMANQAIIKALAEYFGVPKANVRIVSGYTSRQKIIEVL